MYEKKLCNPSFKLRSVIREILLVGYTTRGQWVIKRELSEMDANSSKHCVGLNGRKRMLYTTGARILEQIVL